MIYFVCHEKVKIVDSEHPLFGNIGTVIALNTKDYTGKVRIQNEQGLVVWLRPDQCSEVKDAKTT